MRYSYECTVCRTPYEVEEFSPIGHTILVQCVNCGAPQLVRTASMPAFKRPMEPHYNYAVGQHISSMGQFTSELHRRSDELSETTGADHNFQPVDLTDKKALGVTDEGLDTQAKMRRTMGLDSPTKKIIV